MWVLAGLLSATLVWTAARWAGGVEGALTLGAVGFAVAALVARRHGRVELGVVLLLALLASTLVLVGACAAGRSLLPVETWPGRRYPAVLSGAIAIAGVGIVRRAPWARWLVAALGIGGVLSAGLNLAATCWWLHDRGGNALSGQLPALWTFELLVLGSLSMLVLVSGAGMKRAFNKPFSPDDPSTLWSSSSPLLVIVRALVIAELVAIAMCLLYGWAQPIVPSTAPSALALALSALAGVALTVARKTIGVLVLVLTGGGLLAQSAFTIAGARRMQGVDGAMDDALFYSVFWTLAGVTALACGVALLRAARSLPKVSGTTRSSTPLTDTSP